MFGGGVLFAIGIAFIHQTLHGSDVQFGWLAALWGVGMGVGLGVVRLLVRRGESRVFVVAVAACGGILIVMAVFPYLWLSFVLAVVFGAAFSVAIVIALTLVQRETEDEVRGRIMGGVQMLFRLGLGAGALGMGAIAHSIDTVDLGVITLDGNQVGLIVGGSLIVLGAFAATGAMRASAWSDGRIVRRPDELGYMSRRPSRAWPSVTSSAYSRSPPTGRPLASRVTRTPTGLSSAGDVHRRGVPLQVRVGRQDDLRDAVARDPVQQLLHAKVVGPDALERRDRAAQDVVPALDHAGLLDRRLVLRLLDHADHRGVAAGVAADAAQLALGDAEALAAEPDLLLRGDDRLGQAARVLGRGLDHVEREPLRRLRADAGKARQLVDQVLDRTLVHARPPARRRARP